MRSRLAHAEPPEPLPADEMGNAVAATLLQAATRPEGMAHLLRRQERNERQADALARAWSGRIEDSGTRALDYTRGATRALVVTYG